MNLLDLMVKIGVDDQASDKIGSISTGMITKANLVADAIKGAARSALSAVQGFVSGAVGAYATFEQQVGGMQTFFGDSADTVISNAKKAYDTAGMSANQYMTNVSSFAMSLISSVAKRRQRTVQQDTESYSKALDTQVSNLQKALTKEYNAQRKALSKRVEAQREANDEELERRREGLDAQYESLRKSLDKEVSAFQKATDAKIKDINREYKEKLRLTDEEEYERLKAIDDQIEALDAQTEAERKAAKDREQNQKLADLRYEASNAKFIEDREKAEREIQDLLADIEREGREEERSAQKKSAQEERERIRDEYSKKRDAIKEEQERQVEQYRESRAEELEALRESNAEKLDEVKKNNDAIIKQMSKDHARQIELMQEANESQLESMKDSQDAQLDALRESVARQKEELARAADSQGEYIETTAEDQAEAARIADMAMRDMSDNVNKMGSSMESVEMAYQGFSKQNFTMLDNLKLGYGGTQHEMQRLLDDAEMLKAKNGEVVEYSLDSFADIVEAIHVIQEENGITGTTAEEGATTIEGAMNRAKAAWENWLVAVTSPDADVAAETETMVNTVADAAALIIPKVGEILGNLLTMIGERAPEIWEQFKTEMMNALPPEFKEQFQQVIDALTAIGDAIVQLAAFISENIETIRNLAIAFAAFEIISTVVGFISNLITVFGPLVEAIGGAVAAAGGLQGVIAAIGAALTGPVGIVIAIGAAIAAIVAFVANNEEAQKFLLGVWDGIVDFFSHLPENIGNFLNAAWQTIQNIWGNVTSFMGDAIRGLADGVRDGIESILNWFREIPQNIVNFFSGAGEWLVNAGKNILTGFWNGLTSVWNDLTGWIGDIGNWIQQHKGPESYDRQLLVRNGGWIMEGLQKGLEDQFEDEVIPYVNSMAGIMQNEFGTPVLSSVVGSMNRAAYGMNQGRQQQRQMTVILELDRVQFGRLVYQLNNDETQRVGVQLAGGYA